MKEPSTNVGGVEKLATSLMQEDRWLDAMKILRNRSSETGKYWRLSWNLGWCYFKLGRFDDARAHMMRANRLARNNDICKWGLGSVYLKKRQFKKAEAILLEALQIKESDRSRTALALAYLAQGKIAEAEKMHLENIKLRPKASERYESYAAFLSDVGREAESERMIQKARALRTVQ
jgi:Tfp pilus assembly protein PilF